MINLDLKQYENMHIVVGLSGGPDSVCLFYALKEANCKLYAVHVNHNLRPGDCDEDEKYVRQLCEKEGVECFVSNVKVHTEEEGRKERYQAFAKAVDEIASRGVPRESIAIAVAHNKEDQAETILFRILRGTGTDGLAGMSPVRKDDNGNTIIRPLLDVSRKEIEAYCQEKGLEPRIDKTNNQPIYTRNKIRLELIPYLEREFNGNIVDGIVRLGKVAAQDKEALWKEGKRLFEEASRGVLTFDIKTLASREKALTHRVYSLALEKLGLTEDITMAHINAIDQLVYTMESGPSAMTMLPGDVKVSKAYDQLIFVQSIEKANASDWRVSVLTREEYEQKEKQIPYGAFDLEKVLASHGLEKDEIDIEDIKSFEKRIAIRTRQDGDFFKIPSGTKKLQDFLVDEKVPKLWRDAMIFLAIDREILWILPSPSFGRQQLKEKGRFCGKYMVNSQSKWVLFVEKNC